MIDINCHVHPNYNNISTFHFIIYIHKKCFFWNRTIRCVAMSRFVVFRNPTVFLILFIFHSQTKIIYWISSSTSAGFIRVCHGFLCSISSKSLTLKIYCLIFPSILRLKFIILHVIFWFLILFHKRLFYANSKSLMCLIWCTSYWT